MGSLPTLVVLRPMVGRQPEGDIRLAAPDRCVLQAGRKAVIRCVRKIDDYVEAKQPFDATPV